MNTRHHQRGHLNWGQGLGREAGVILEHKHGGGRDQSAGFRNSSYSAAVVPSPPEGLPGVGEPCLLVFVLFLLTFVAVQVPVGRLIKRPRLQRSSQGLGGICRELGLQT